MRDRVYTAEMGQPPMEPDGGSVTPAPKRVGMPAARKPVPKRPAPPMKKIAPKGDIFREGMPVPQDIDGASAAPRAPGMKKGGAVSSASRRADGIAKRGKTKGTFV